MQLPPIVVNIAFATLIPAFLFAGVEGVSRLVEPTDSTKQETNIQLDMPSWMVEAQAKPKTFTQSEVRWMKSFQSGEGFRVHLVPGTNEWFDDTFSWLRHLPDSGFQVRANEQGFRVREKALTPPSSATTRNTITFFGDSSTFGWGVNAEDAYPFLLEEELESTAPDREIEIRNFAMPGDSSEFGRLLFDAVAEKPIGETVVISFGANDARLSSVRHADQVARFRSQTGLLELRTQLAEKSAFVRLLERALAPKEDAKKSAEQERAEAVPLGRYRKNLRFLIEQSQAFGAKRVVLVNLCSPPRYTKAMKLVAQNQGVDYYGAQAHLMQSIRGLQSGKREQEAVSQMQKRYPHLLRQHSVLYVTSDACHPNPVGHRIIAKRLAKMIGRS